MESVPGEGEMAKPRVAQEGPENEAGDGSHGGGRTSIRDRVAHPYMFSRFVDFPTSACREPLGMSAACLEAGGYPPIGSLIDFAAFFIAEGVVSISMIVTVLHGYHIEISHKKQKAAAYDD